MEIKGVADSIVFFLIVLFFTFLNCIFSHFFELHFFSLDFFELYLFISKNPGEHFFKSQTIQIHPNIILASTKSDKFISKCLESSYFKRIEKFKVTITIHSYRISVPIFISLSDNRFA
jgi:hypothetical protein